MNKSDLEKENALLKRQIEEMGNLQGSPDVSAKLMAEVNQLNKMSQQSSAIRVKEIQDHKNVYVYHHNGLQIGKRIGPLHPANASWIMQKFFNKGIIISVNPVTDEKIKVYKETEEYKKLKAAFDKTRKDKEKSRKKGEVERLAALISNMSGQKVVNTLKPEPVHAG